ncbi:hypothetical protein BDZ89DRAFT_1068268 [Hymenopellis radicata]|nr:hypothetical protein BDZ89DRAFT_1068268 [Hymenopellis radicata]
MTLVISLTVVSTSRSVRMTLASTSVMTYDHTMSFLCGVFAYCAVLFRTYLPGLTIT